MGLMAIIKNLFVAKITKPTPINKLIGNTEPVCPYCDSNLDKFPGRKKKCPKCGEFIFVRTRPNDNKKILIKEGQIVEVEELWSVKNGTHEDFLAERRKYNDQKNKLTSELGREPSENDVKLVLLEKDLESYANDYRWGLYRNAILSIGDILKKESKIEEALDRYLEVCYIDLNGPNNCGTRDPELLAEFPPFDPKDAFLAPGVIGYVEKLMDIMELDSNDIEGRFKSISKNIRVSLDLKVDENKAWNKLKKEFL